MTSLMTSLMTLAEDLADALADGLADGLADCLPDGLVTATAGRYAALQTFRPSVAKGAVPIRCEDDLWRHYARDPYWMQLYLMQDNATCTRPIAKLGPPGYGGAYAGSKPRCVASHDLRSFAQPDVCSSRNGKPPHQPGTSFADFESFPYPSDGERYDWQADRWKK